MHSAADDPQSGPGFPIRTSLDQRSLPTPQGFSQVTTSFIASQRQDIHRMPLRPDHADPKSMNFRHLQLPRLSRIEERSFVSSAATRQAHDGLLPTRTTWPSTTRHRQAVEHVCPSVWTRHVERTASRRRATRRSLSTSRILSANRAWGARLQHTQLAKEPNRGQPEGA